MTMGTAVFHELVHETLVNLNKWRLSPGPGLRVRAVHVPMQSRLGALSCIISLDIADCHAR